MHFPASFCLADDYMAASIASANKSERTRLRILGLTTALLSEVPFADLAARELAQHAGVARTLIYHYFTDLAGLATEIANDYQRRSVESIGQLAVTQGHYSYADIIGYLSWILAVAMRNRGPMRLMHVHREQLPKVAEIFGHFLFNLNKSVGDTVDAPTNIAYGAPERLITGIIISGGFDSVIRELFVFPNSLLPMIKTTRELFELVQVLAIFRHRAVHGRDPTQAETDAVVEAFDLSFFEPSLSAIQSASLQLSKAPAPPIRKRMMSP